MSESKPVDFAPDTENTRQRIVRAASQVFSEFGYSGATTRAIAATAGVNEVTLFRYFGDKKSLMLEVARQRSAIPGMETALKDKFTGDCRQDLCLIGREYLGLMLERRREILTSIVEADRIPEIKEFIAYVPRMQNQMLGGYFRQQIARGVMREMNSEMAAQAFFGMFMSYSIMLGLTGDSATSAPVEAVIDQFVNIFLEGISRR
jgi:AcrR family transcriptional regulator